MKFLLFIIPLTFLAFTNPKDELILWGSRTIEWSDFKAKPNKSKITVALTASTITLNSKYNSNNDLIISVQNYFITNKSWTSTTDSIVLEHERRHFDLSEIYARKIRKAFAQKKFNAKKLNAEINSIFEKYYADLNLQQNKYDSETKHSINKEKQIQWSAKIESELRSLDEYNQIDIIVKY